MDTNEQAVIAWFKANTMMVASVIATIGALVGFLAAYVLGTTMSGYFGVDPSAPLKSQPNGGIFFAGIMALFIVFALFGFAAGLVVVSKFAARKLGCSPQLVRRTILGYDAGRK